MNSDLQVGCSHLVSAEILSDLITSGQLYCTVSTGVNTPRCIEDAFKIRSLRPCLEVFWAACDHILFAVCTLYIKIFLYFLHKIFAYRAVRWIRSQVVKIHVSARCELMGVKMSACELAAHYASFLFSLYECQPNVFDYLAGVIGSVIHYPKDMAEMATEMKDNGYRTL